MNETAPEVDTSTMAVLRAELLNSRRIVAWLVPSQTVMTVRKL